MREAGRWGPQGMLSDLCNMLVACGIDIPRGRLPPVRFHNSANFVAETIEVGSPPAPPRPALPRRPRHMRCMQQPGL